jgi:hypothetical protein
MCRNIARPVGEGGEAIALSALNHLTVARTSGPIAAGMEGKFIGGGVLP